MKNYYVKNYRIKKGCKMSSWDSQWEDVYNNQEWGKYPPEELIRFVARNFYKISDRNKIKILDVGCGTGAGTWYMAREGFVTYAIDGSKTAIKVAEDRFIKENLKGNFQVGDINKLPYPDNYFDAVTDIVAIQHNKFQDIHKIIKEIYRVLKPQGKLFSMMVKNDSYGYGLGRELEKNTFTNIIEGPYAGKGVIHFTDLNEIKEIFDIFELVEIECGSRTINNLKNIISHYVIFATK